jgi:peptide/nickel transport system permease protein
VLIAGFAVSRIGSSLDRALSHLTLVLYSLPTFWIGMLLLLVFAFMLGLFPSSQMMSVRTEGEGGLAAFGDLLSHLVLPALTMAIPGAAALARYLRTSIEETLREDYVLAARGMGLTEWSIFRSYVLPNAAGPALSLLGIEAGVLLTGVVVTETLFSWPGMGRVAVLSVFARDYPMILGCSLLGGCVVILANIVTDVLKAWLNPRMRLA